MKIFGKEYSNSFVILVTCVAVIVFFLYKVYKRNKYKSTVLEKAIKELKPVYDRIDKLDIRPKYNCAVEESNTEDKKIIYICLCDIQGENYSQNKIKQIILHEISHILSVHVDKDHTSQEFTSTYNMLMNKAYRLGVISKAKVDNGEFYEDGRKRKYLDEDKVEEVEEDVNEELNDIAKDVNTKSIEDQAAQQMLDNDDYVNIRFDDEK